MKNLFGTLPRFNCSERCQAPNAFFSGSPFLSIPTDGKLELKESESKEIEWQIWTDKNSIDDLTFSINGKEIYNTDGYSKDGMVFTMKKRDVRFFGKFIKIEATVKIERNPSASKWTISVANNKDGGKTSNQIVCKFKQVHNLIFKFLFFISKL